MRHLESSLTFFLQQLMLGFDSLASNIRGFVTPSRTPSNTSSSGPAVVGNGPSTPQKSKFSFLDKKGVPAHDPWFLSSARTTTT